VDVDQLIGIAVGDVDRIGRGRERDPGDQILVEQQGDPRIELRPAVLASSELR